MAEFSPELFRPAGNKPQDDALRVRPRITYWQDVWYRLEKNKLALAGMILVGMLMVLALIGPWLTPFTYSEQLLALKNKPPGYHFYVKLQMDSAGGSHIVDYSSQPIAAEQGFKIESRTYWLGSDSLGRDLFTRNCYGARISFTVGIVTALLVFVIGTIYGGISGLIGGWVDEVMMRLVEILSAVPFLLYVILLMVLMEPGLKTVFIALGAVYWLPMARLVRGQILALKEQEYVMAARALGAGTWRILFRHLIPNTMGPIMVYVMLSIPDAIFTEAWLSFIGLGVSAPVASWGALANDGVKAIRSYPWQLFFPAASISLTILAFNVFGDGLRDALDPRTRK